MEFKVLLLGYDHRQYNKFPIHRRCRRASPAVLHSLEWPVCLILTIFFDPIVQGINRILRGNVIIGLLWIISGGIFAIGWVVDIITMVIHKDITFLA